MITMDERLAELVAEGKVLVEAAFEKALDKDRFRKLTQPGGRPTPSE
jgi:Tfp pilus assembly pilus retraction ATPase PilT